MSEALDFKEIQRRIALRVTIVAELKRIVKADVLDAAETATALVELLASRDADEAERISREWVTDNSEDLPMVDSRHDNPPRGKARPGWHSVAVEMCFHPDWLPKPIEWSTDADVLIEGGELVDWDIEELTCDHLEGLVCLHVAGRRDGDGSVEWPELKKRASDRVFGIIDERLIEAARKAGIL